MLDKSVPYFRVILKRTAGTPLPQAALPEGYSFRLYQPGDEKDWGEIETSVLEFDDAAKAAAYYQEHYGLYQEEAARRTLFLCAPDGGKVGTFTAWWCYTGVRRYPLVSWVALRPAYQGKGLGKALIARGVRLMAEIEGDVRMYFPTQSWSHKAIKLYQWAGFSLVTDEEKPGGFDNQTPQAMPILQQFGIH